MKPRDFYIPQFRLDACGISCLQMALRYFNADQRKPRNKQEMRLREEGLYECYGLKHTDHLPNLAGTMGSAIAYALFLHGLDVTLAHASDRLLENYGNYYDDAYYRAFRLEHLHYICKAQMLKLQYAQAAMENGGLHLQPSGSFTVERGVSVACSRLREELAQGRLVITQIMIDGDADGMHTQVMHWILLYSSTDDGFLALDPLSGRQMFTDAELIKRMHTPFGGTFISVGRNR